MEHIDADGMPCAMDEFYDGVVEMCSKCSDVCHKRLLDDPANHFCKINCPGDILCSNIYESELLG